MNDALANTDGNSRERSSSISIMRLTTQNTDTHSLIGRKERILRRRGAFTWMLVLCSNDVVHGSWWFVWGSFLAMVVPVLVLANPYIHVYKTYHDTLPALGFYVTWIMVLVSSLFLTFGSLAFVRAFEEPPLEPIFHKYKHIQTDELLAAWLFLCGTLPSVPYSLVWFFYEPGQIIYLAVLVASCTFTFITYLFVLACYPSDKKHKQVVKPCARKLLGRDHWIIKHVQNDWLAGMWLMLIATLFCCLGTLMLLLSAAAFGSDEECFIYGMGLLDFVMYLIGSFYFVAGSYPEDKNKCYKTPVSKPLDTIQENSIEDDHDHVVQNPLRKRNDPREAGEDDFVDKI